MIDPQRLPYPHPIENRQGSDTPGYFQNKRLFY
jgi:hypothetical protein